VSFARYCLELLLFAVVAVWLFAVLMSDGGYW